MSLVKKIFLALFIIVNANSYAQEYGEKVPKRAALYSAIIPGAGQVYTKKYWKVPIIYAGLITSVYYINESNDFYQLYKSTYLNRINEITTDEFQGTYSDSDLKTLTDHYRRNREVSVLLFTLTYVLNIVDASVNAHLFDYDVSDELSLHIKPMYFSKENATGLSLSFNL